MRKALVPLRSLLGAALCFALLIAAITTVADQVVLKSGRVLQGKIVERTDAAVVIEDADGLRISITTDKIGQIIADEPSEKAQPDSPSSPAALPELVIQNGHSGWVYSVAFSPDGEVVASTSNDGTIRLWSVATGELIRLLEEHENRVSWVAFSPDGKTLASAGGDRTILVWNIASGESILTIKGHDGEVLSVAYSPDGKTIASTGKDKTVRLWNAATGEPVLTMQGHTDFVNSVAFSPDGKTLASVGDDKTIRLWNATTGESLNALKGHTGGVKSVAFGPDGKTLASTGENNTIRLWNTATGESIRVWRPDIRQSLGLNDFKKTIRSVVFSPDGKTIASGSFDGKIRILDVASGEQIRTMEGHTGGIYSVAFSPDGKTIASAGGDRIVRLWAPASGEELRSMKGYAFRINSIAFSPDGKTIVSGSYDNFIRVWDLPSGELLRSLTGHTYSVNSLAFSPDGKTIASGSTDRNVRLWDAATGKSIRILEGFSGVNSLAFSPDGKTIVSGNRTAGIDMWNSSSGELIRTLKGHADEISCIAFSTDGKTFASSSHDKTIRLWDAATGELLHTMEGHAHWINTIAFSPDGKTLASGSIDGALRIWDASTGEPIHLMKEHRFALNSLAYSPDGKTLVSGHGIRSIYFWNTATNEPAGKIEGQIGEVATVAFSPDGKLLAMGNANGSLKLFNAADGQLLSTMTAFDDGNWFVTDLAGRFDCSGCARGDADSGKKYIRWIVGATLYKPDQFFDKFYTPGLLADVVASGKMEAVENLGTVLADVPPDVKIIYPPEGKISSGDTVKVKVLVKDMGGGALNVRLLMQGRPVGSDPVDATPAGAQPGERTYTFDAPLVPGNNRLTALATSRSGVDSREAEVVVTSTSQENLAPPELYFLTVGINQYKNTAYNLNLAVPDADAFHDVIVKGGTGLYAKVHEYRLRDATATRDALRAALDEILRKAGPNDMVIVYLAGHGATAGGGWFFLPHEMTKSDDDAIRENAYSERELKAFLKQLKSRKVVLVLDACQSGAISMSRGLDRDKVMRDLARTTGTFVLAASNDAQAAMEITSLGHGVFTYTLLEGLAGAADLNKNDAIEVKELEIYAGEKVSEYTEKYYGKRQDPFVWEVTGGGGGYGPTLVVLKH